jgi:ADP-ribose pyrophosphatase
MRDFTEKTLESRTVFKGKIIEVRTDKVKLPNGRESYREIVLHRGAVAAVPYEDGKVFLVRQFRYAARSHLLEVPAGKLDEDEEDPEWRIRKELREEIGMDPNRLIYLGYVYTSPGFATEKIHLYLALNLKEMKEEADEDEFLEVIEFDFEEAYEMCLDGRINDSKTIAALIRAKKVLEEGI